MPLTAGVVVPYLLARGDVHLAPAHTTAGVGLAALGWSMVVWTNALFVRIGLGTLAPWDPTKRLVVAGPFAHVRNPMISGVACAIAGVALATWSSRVGGWLLAFLLVNHVYFIVSEEPGLRRRFAADYDAYAAAVPRWWPRLRAWRPPSAQP